eukprot:13912_1
MVLFSWFILLLIIRLVSSIQPYNLRVEYQQNPIGIDVNPRFFWMINAGTVRGAKQTAYHIIVYNNDNGKQIADTGKILSSQSSHITISNITLISHTNYKWTVQIYDKLNNESCIEIAYFSVGILDSKEWNKANWIGISNKDSATSNQLRTEFIINQTSPIYKSIAYIASPGYYKIWLNTELIDDHELGHFTQFELRSYYDVISITNLKTNGTKNIICCMLGNGWYSQPSVAVGTNMIKIIIRIVFENNEILTIYTNNNSWYQSEGPVRINDIYIGEYYDATKETSGWLLPSYNYSNHSWKRASVINNPIIGKLQSSTIMPKIKKTMQYSPVDISQPSNGIFVVDFGQNVAGFCRIKIQGNNRRGHNITIMHSEELQPNGYIRQVWPVEAPMMYNITLRGDGNEEIYQAYFTYFGYQYVQIIGYPGVITINDIVSYFVHTDLDTSTNSIQFGPSNDNDPTSNAYLINKIQHMTRYSALSNYMNIPTDCPTRERHGWLGDANLASETLIYNFDMASSYTKFLLDIRDTQIKVNGSGELPNIAPWYKNGGIPGSIEWTTAYVNLVYRMYHFYGDIEIINTHYIGLKQYMSATKKGLNANGILPNTYSGPGDWDALYPSSIPTTSCSRKSTLTNTFEWAQQNKYMSILAAAIGNNKDYETYLNQYYDTRNIIYKYFWNKTENLFIDPQKELSLQSAQSFGLQIDALNDTNEIKQCMNNLVKDIRITHNYHIGTGIVGTKSIWTQLCRYGYCDIALNASIQKTIPGYGWWVIQGANTLWEHWDATKFNSSLCKNPGTKNHIMFGSQGSWYYSSLAGIKQQYLNSSNWNNIVIDPYTNASIFGVNFVNAEINTLNGPLITKWQVYTNVNNNKNNNSYYQIDM